ncbi:HPP family protein [Thiosulfativibrio zosterae]|uniref:HPP transmembrane region domain-containing protein n=1 Tax=Thiosulfativibrio zosterae TaxID=2675053 RepID=A0A6F8PK96_9GAMM|nr:HPP family protein [Thiosulfativibrio zosterae]BBP42522.1 hypothetical protein THMIRHAT_02680 [Thiosulfativibrio zosterae]
MQRFWHHLKQFVGYSDISYSHTEKTVSALGGFVAILGILWVTESLLGFPASLALVVSMGASSILLFANPHGQISQPWSLFGGHLLAAAIGVTCAQWISEPFVAGALTIGLSIAGMQYFRCIHPPGGATGLTAVLGGEQIQQLGYSYLLTPVLLDLLILLTVAMAFNSLFNWRRYPAYFQRQVEGAAKPSLPTQQTSLTHGDFLDALKQMDSFIDVNEHDLKKLFELASQSAQQSQLSAEDIQLGRCYSNGAINDDWEVRQIIDESPNALPEKDQVIFKQVAGKRQTQSQHLSRQAFAHWAKFEVAFENNHWVRKTADSK